MKEKSSGKIVNAKIGNISVLLEFPDKDICWLPFSVIKGVSIIKSHNADIIFTSGPKHSNLITSQVLKILTKKS